MLLLTQVLLWMTKLVVSTSLAIDEFQQDVDFILVCLKNDVAQKEESRKLANLSHDATVENLNKLLAKIQSDYPGTNAHDIGSQSSLDASSLESIVKNYALVEEEAFKNKNIGFEEYSKIVKNMQEFIYDARNYPCNVEIDPLEEIKRSIIKAYNTVAHSENNFNRDVDDIKKEIDEKNCKELDYLNLLLSQKNGFTDIKNHFINILEISEEVESAIRDKLQGKAACLKEENECIDCNKTGEESCKTRDSPKASENPMNSSSHSLKQHIVSLQHGNEKENKVPDISEIHSVEHEDSGSYSGIIDASTYNSETTAPKSISGFSSEEMFNFYHSDSNEYDSSRKRLSDSSTDEFSYSSMIESDYSISSQESTESLDYNDSLSEEKMKSSSSDSTNLGEQKKLLRFLKGQGESINFIDEKDNRNHNEKPSSNNPNPNNLSNNHSPKNHSLQNKESDQNKKTDQNEIAGESIENEPFERSDSGNNLVDDERRVKKVNSNFTDNNSREASVPA